MVSFDTARHSTDGAVERVNSSILLISPWLLAIVGAVASTIFGIALYIVGREYFSIITRKKKYRYV